jgi:hypothetical protein
MATPVFCAGNRWCDLLSWFHDRPFRSLYFSEMDVNGRSRLVGWGRRPGEILPHDVVNPPFRTLSKAETSTHTFDATISVPDVPVQATLFAGYWFPFWLFPILF